jgi:hypothetical protein
MSKKTIEKPKLSPMAELINRQLAEAGPPEECNDFACYPEILTRRKTQIEKEREEEGKGRASRYIVKL